MAQNLFIIVSYKVHVIAVTTLLKVWDLNIWRNYDIIAVLTWGYTLIIFENIDHDIVLIDFIMTLN